MISAGTSFAASDDALEDGNLTSLVSDDTLSIEDNNDYIGNNVTSDDVLSNDYTGRNTHFSASDNVVYSYPTVKEDRASYAIFLSTNDIIPIPLNNKTIHVEFNGKSTDYTTNIIGMVNYIIPSNTPAGEFYVNMKFDGDDVYAGSSLTTSIKIVGVETEILALKNISYSRTLIEEGLGIYPIALTTNSTIPTPLANKTVIVEFNDVSSEFITNDLGLIYYNISKNCPSGNYTLKATYAGDKGYLASEFTTSIEIYDAGARIIAPQNVVYSYFEVANGSAKVPMILLSTNTVIPLPLSNRTVYVEFNGIKTYCTTNWLGMIDYKLFESPVGNYTYTMTFEGDGKYNYSTATVNVEITKGNMTIHADYNNDTHEIVATIINNFTGNPVSNAKLKVSLNGAESTVKSNSKGQITISTEGLDSGTYTAIISYAGNSKYNPAEESIYFDVKTTMNIIATYDAYSNAIIATLTNMATGKTIVNAYVHVDIDDMTYTVKTNSNGQAKVSTADLPTGTHTAIISYAGNSKYGPTNASIDFDIKKVMITDIYGDSEKLTATLTNSETGKAVTNAKMQVDINGVKTTVKSNSKGMITVSTNDLGLKIYTATISYSGNSKYSPSSATTTIDLDKSNMVITYTYYAEKQEMVATLKNSKTGKTVINANIVVDINGVKTTLKSNSKGQISFSTADWTPGTHVGTITYGGNDNYNAISTVFKVDV